MDNTPRVDQDEGLVGPFNEAAACQTKPNHR
jgi:hypothetical protein